MPLMANADVIERALHSPEPFEQLRATAAAWFAEGRTEKAVYDLFDDARTQLRVAGREADEDVVMEVMDCLVGWCSPHQVLKPTAVAPTVNGHGSPDQTANAPPSEQR
jgi:hypothetical protein